MSKIGIKEVRDNIDWLYRQVNVHKHSCVGKAEKEQWCSQADFVIDKVLEQLSGPMTPAAKKLANEKLFESVDGVDNPDSLIARVRNDITKMKEQIVIDYPPEDAVRESSNVIKVDFGGAPVSGPAAPVVPDKELSALLMSESEQAELKALLNAFEPDGYDVDADFEHFSKIGERDTDAKAEAEEKEYAQQLHAQNTNEWVFESLIAYLPETEGEGFLASEPKKMHAVVTGVDLESIKPYFAHSEQDSKLARDIAYKLVFEDMTMDQLTKQEVATLCKLYTQYQSATEAMPEGAKVGTKEYKQESASFLKRVEGLSALTSLDKDNSPGLMH